MSSSPVDPQNRPENPESGGRTNLEPGGLEPASGPVRNRSQSIQRNSPITSIADLNGLTSSGRTGGTLFPFTPDPEAASSQDKPDRVQPILDAFARIWPDPQRNFQTAAQYFGTTRLDLVSKSALHKLYKVAEGCLIRQAPSSQSAQAADVEIAGPTDNNSNQPDTPDNHDRWPYSIRERQLAFEECERLLRKATRDKMNNARSFSAAVDDPDQSSSLNPKVRMKYKHPTRIKKHLGVRDIQALYTSEIAGWSRAAIDGDAAHGLGDGMDIDGTGEGGEAGAEEDNGRLSRVIRFDDGNESVWRNNIENRSRTGTPSQLVPALPVAHLLAQFSSPPTTSKYLTVAGKSFEPRFKLVHSMPPPTTHRLGILTTLQSCGISLPKDTAIDAVVFTRDGKVVINPGADVGATNSSETERMTGHGGTAGSTESSGMPSSSGDENITPPGPSPQASTQIRPLESHQYRQARILAQLKRWSIDTRAGLWDGFETGWIVESVEERLDGSAKPTVYVACAGIPPMVPNRHKTVDLLARVFASENVLSREGNARSNIREIGQAELPSAILGLKRDESVAWLISSPDMETKENPRLLAHAQEHPQMQCLLDMHNDNEVESTYAIAVETSIANALRQYGPRTRVELEAIAIELQASSPSPPQSVFISWHKAVLEEITNPTLLDEPDLSFVDEPTRTTFFDGYRSYVPTTPTKGEWIVCGAGAFEELSNGSGRVITVVAGWMIFSVEDLDVPSGTVPYNRRLLKRGDIIVIPSYTRHAIYHLSDTITISQDYYHESDLPRMQNTLETAFLIEPNRLRSVLHAVFSGMSSLVADQPSRTISARQQRLKAVEFLVGLIVRQAKTQFEEIIPLCEATAKVLEAWKSV